MPPGSVLQISFPVNDASFNVGFFAPARKVKVMIVCDVKANKKLPPHCMLASVRDGKILKMTDSASPAHAVPYKLARQTLAFSRDQLAEHNGGHRPTNAGGVTHETTMTHNRHELRAAGWQHKLRPTPCQLCGTRNSRHGELRKKRVPTKRRTVWYSLLVVYRGLRMVQGS